jgi:hypothetical protein
MLAPFWPPDVSTLTPGTTRSTDAVLAGARRSISLALIVVWAKAAFWRLMPPPVVPVTMISPCGSGGGGAWSAAWSAVGAYAGAGVSCAAAGLMVRAMAATDTAACRA